MNKDKEFLKKYSIIVENTSFVWIIMYYAIEKFKKYFTYYYCVFIFRKSMFFFFVILQLL